MPLLCLESISCLLRLNIPNPYCLIFTVAEQLTSGIKHHTTYIMVVPRYRRMLPSNLRCVLPQLNLPIIGGRSNEVQVRMESNPIYSPLMTLKNLDALYLYSHKCSEIFVLSESFPEDREVPEPHSCIKRARDNQILIYIRFTFSSWNCAHIT